MPANVHSIIVSIIIPVFKDWYRLNNCLEALATQSYSRHLFEIIIVNNDIDTIPGFKIPENGTLLKEVKKGSYAARNTGLRVARGEIVGFTDSDCIPSKDWIKNAVSYLQSHRDYSRVAGKVELYSERPEPNIADKYELLYAFDQRRYVRFGTSITANLFTYRHVFDTVGVFKEDLFSGGDYLWGYQANQAGFKIDYVESVAVKHPTRSHLSDLIRKERRVGGGQAQFMNPEKNNFQNFLIFLKALRPKREDLKIVFIKGKSLGLRTKIILMILRQYLVAVRAFERLLVKAGKSPNRQ